VPSTTARKPRVLLGNLEPISRLGMLETLASGGLEVVDQEGDNALVAQVARVIPDVVILGLDEGSGRELGEQVRAAAPNAKVILWTRDETAMEVFEPGSEVPRRVASGVRDALLNELTGVQATRAKE
jgi:DNA-binding NarL/FixJ family response regulator